MEHIQCPHCDKKYAVSDKLRSAAGKKIRCKHCENIFEIIILDGASQPEPPTTKATPTAEKATSKKKPPKKKNNTQLIITIVLATTLVIGAVGGYLYLNHPDLFSASEKQKPQPVIPQELIKPIQIMPEAPTDTSTDTQQETQSVQPTTTHADPTASPASKMPEILEQRQATTAPTPSASILASQRCKDVLASYWFRSYQLATVRMDTGVYMQLLGENLDQSEKIRTLCKDASLVGKIIASVKSEQKPDWIRKEIEALIEADRLQKEQAEANKD